MAKKSNENNIRKITKIGGHSYAVSIPISLMREWRWKERQKVVLKINRKSKSIIIKDWKK